MIARELAAVYIKRESYAEALDMYRKARAVGLPRIGSCLMSLGREEEALAAFEATLALDPGNISTGLAGFKLARSRSTCRFSAT